MVPYSAQGPDIERRCVLSRSDRVCRVWADTADLSTLADENWPSLEVTGAAESGAATPAAHERTAEVGLEVCGLRPGGSPCCTPLIVALDQLGL